MYFHRCEQHLPTLAHAMLTHKKIQHCYGLFWETHYICFKRHIYYNKIKIGGGTDFRSLDEDFFFFKNWARKQNNRVNYI